MSYVGRLPRRDGKSLPGPRRLPQLAVVAENDLRALERLRFSAYKTPALFDTALLIIDPKRPAAYAHYR